ncbi:MAG: DUF2520 domain-containing protein [Flavobacteriaceae bacterium]|jgi:predicted short-subunit dehydrogenase-like oxidoreductase (DUF2520 family)|nr:DUF2520 domain-containing protein [Flavobacteriaceae bacterium]
MKLAIIGSGNVAYHLAKAFVENGVSISQIFGRNESELQKISGELQIPFSVKNLENANVYIISVSDSAIREVSKKIKNSDVLAVHTSGSASRNALNGNFRKGVFYPLQTFSKSRVLDYSEIPFFIDAENENDKLLLKNLAEKISKKVLFADDEMRKYIHLTAVFACNFVNHLFSRAKEISDSQKIPFDYFFPLIEETVKKIHEIEPKFAQTGPAVRNDENTLLLHESLISDEQQLKIYKTINESIKKMYNL